MLALLREREGRYMPLLRDSEPPYVKSLHIYIRGKRQDGFNADIVRAVKQGRDRRCGVWYELADSARPEHRVHELTASLLAFVCLDVAELVAEYTMDVFAETDFEEGTFRLPMHYRSHERGGGPCGWRCAPRVTADMLRLCVPGAPLRYDELEDHSHGRRSPHIATTRKDPLF